MATITDLLSAAETLSQDELQVLSARIMGLLNIPSDDTAVAQTCNCCRRCSSKQVVKYGKDKNGKQRYKCKCCNTVFYEDSYSVVSRTHCSHETWRKYIDQLLRRSSLQQCASVCNISVRTAFIWRHKILSALQKDQDNRVLSGIIEADETFFGISYKGNHTKSKDFVMPRKAYKRGTDSREQTGSRACVMCAIERNGQVYGEVLGKGQPTIGMLSHAFDERILPESVVISDRALGIKNYFKNNQKAIQLIRLKSHMNRKNQNTPPEVVGAFHIQNINNMHYRFRKALEPYYGVSTKYLNHYLNLYVWIENHKSIPNIDLHQELCSSIHNQDSYMSFHDICSLPPVPTVA